VNRASFTRSSPRVSPDRSQPLVADLHMTTANALTTLRIILIVPFIYFLGEGRYGLAFAVFFAASVTDFFDGYVARRFNQQTSLGRILDPLADKVLVTAAYIVMAIPHANLPSIPIWLAVAVIGRDLLILLGALVVLLLTKQREFQPSFISKANTMAELGFIQYFLIVYAFDLLAPLRILKPFCYVIVLVTVLLSGVDYVGKGIGMLRAGSTGEKVGV
jgi:cardiolipin synthase